MKKRAQHDKKRIRWALILTVFVLLIGIIAIAFAGVHLLSPKTNTSPKSCLLYTSSNFDKVTWFYFSNFH